MGAVALSVVLCLCFTIGLIYGGIKFVRYTAQSYRAYAAHKATGCGPAMSARLREESRAREEAKAQDAARAREADPEAQ